MKKILKSELTPQLVKHQEATLQLFNIQRDSFPSPPNVSASESYRLAFPTPLSISSDHEN